tara:strand:- start:6511 stop:6981 length:471 start_codon:yes stop_codon:yes gene_type:complete
MENIEIRLANPDELASLLAMFEKMYEHFHVANGFTTLAEGGFERWMHGYERSCDVSRVVLVAYSDSKPCGFIEGQIRLASPTAIAEKTGHVAHLFVEQRHRRSKVGQQLFTTLSDWFASKRIRRESLEVVCNNMEGSEFWVSVGFKPLFVTYGRET